METLVKIEAGEHVTTNVKLLRPLGEGGMGAVWVAEHLALGTEVAVKFLLGGYADDAGALSRFSQEAAAASQVKSSHVVKVYDYGLTDTKVPFIVMELLEGTTLADRIKDDGKLSPAFVASVTTQLCKALERAHEKNVVHRDVKPENIFLTNEGGDVFVKLLDFGIAKTEKLSKKTTGGRRSTMAGESLGTPFYMSPEQFKNSKEIDYRTDLWSVGIVVYEALTGVLPFVADTVSALAIIVNDAVAPGPSTFEPGLPAGIDAWFAKACARAPTDRFQSARELADQLRMALGQESDAGKVSLSDSGGRIVVKSFDASDITNVERMSLRDTAFATSGGNAAAGQARKRTIPIVVAAAAGAALVVGGIVWLTHGKSPAQPSPPVQTAVATPTPPAPPAAGSDTAAASTESRPLASSAAVPSVAVPTPTSKPVVKPVPSASASTRPKGASSHERDIW